MASHHGMFGRGSPRKELFADEALAHALPDDEKCCRAVEFAHTQNRLFS
jgi:hypothetical protein